MGRRAAQVGIDVRVHIDRRHRGRAATDDGQRHGTRCLFNGAVADVLHRVCPGSPEDDIAGAGHGRSQLGVVVGTARRRLRKQEVDPDDQRTSGTDDVEQLAMQGPGERPREI